MGVRYPFLKNEKRFFIKGQFFAQFRMLDVVPREKDSRKY
jgi:hypothetical protein